MKRLLYELARLDQLRYIAARTGVTPTGAQWNALEDAVADAAWRVRAKVIWMAGGGDKRALGGWSLGEQKAGTASLP